jgi:hypothetical protein
MKQRKLRQVSEGPKPALTRLKELPAEDRAKLMLVLRENTYDKAEPVFENTVGFHCSRQVLSKFFAWQGSQEELENSNDLIAQYEEFCRKQNPDWKPERVRDNAIAFFMMQTTGNKDREGFVEIASLDLKERQARTKASFEERKISLSERKVRLLEQKAAQADAAKQLLENNELSEADRRSRMHEIFGIS